MLGDGHAHTALNSLAETYRLQGDYARAEPLYQEALAICLKLFGDLEPETARIQSNLATLYASRGDLKMAEPLYRHVIAVSQVRLGTEHPETAARVNNLATLYVWLADYARAEPLYQQVLAVRRKVVGDEHPDTARTLADLAGLYTSMGQSTRFYDNIWTRKMGKLAALREAQLWMLRSRGMRDLAPARGLTIETPKPRAPDRLSPFCWGSVRIEW